MEKNNLELIGMPRIIESNFKLNPIYDFLDLKDIEFELHIESETEEINLSNHVCLYKLKVNVSDAEKNFNAYVVAEGVFKIKDNLENYKEILKNKGSDILISFIRPYIVSLTTAAGMQPIILPILDFEIK